MQTYRLNLVLGGGEFTSRVEARSLAEAVKLFAKKPYLQEFSESELESAITVEDNELL